MLVNKISAGALALALAAYADVRLGNFDTTPQSVTPEYFSVSLNVGQNFRYTGSIEDGTMLIDDITYTVDLDPCGAQDRCVVFDLDTVTTPMDQINATTSYDPAGFWVQDFAGGLPANAAGGLVTRWSRARGTFFRAALVNGPAGAVGPAFDAISHTLYGQVVAREKILGSPIPPNSGPFPDPDYYGIDPTVGGGVGVGVTATPTSQSRHYQSPEIVAANARVSFQDNSLTLNPGRTVYRDAIAFIKGRVVPGASAPTRTTSFTTENN